jgi:hypothetical protein
MKPKRTTRPPKRKNDEISNIDSNIKKKQKTTDIIQVDDDEHADVDEQSNDVEDDVRKVVNINRYWRVFLIDGELVEKEVHRAQVEWEKPVDSEEQNYVFLTDMENCMSHIEDYLKEKNRQIEEPRYDLSVSDPKETYVGFDKNTDEVE